MTAELYAAYALVFVGLGILAWTTQRLLAMRINTKAANSVLIKLLRAGNVDRARKLCAAAPGTYFDALAAALDAPDTDVVAVNAAFDTVGVKVVERWTSVVSRGWLGTLFVAGGLAFALSGGTVPYALGVAGGGGALLSALLYVRRDDAARALASARRDVLPELVRVGN